MCLVGELLVETVNKILLIIIKLILLIIHSNMLRPYYGNPQADH